MLSSLFNYFKSKLPNTATIKTTVMYAWSWTKTTTVMYSWSLYEINAKPLDWVLSHWHMGKL